MALNVAEDFHRRYLPPSGGFIEYDRCSWLEPHRLWRTVPWGTAFRGREMLSVWEKLRGDLSPESALWWQDALERVGRWLHGNPTLGSFVFNYALDGCYLLWRLGRALERPDWMEWAMRTAHARIERDVDGEGWIQGEEGGCSGNYQIVGTRFLALFAWESNDEVLKATIGRISNVLLQWSTPNLLYPGNFGTRTNALYPLQGHRAEFLLVTAAFGNETAAHAVQRFASPDWSTDLSLWECALRTPARALEFTPVRRFEGLESVRVQHGPFVAYFCNYNRSLWARGLCNLWHEASGEMIFSTLHSLPTHVPKDKLHLGDTSDWAGFPHVRVTGESGVFDSQRRIQNLKIEESEGVTVRWDEPLCDANDKIGGSMRSKYRFEGERLTMQIELSDLAGSCHLDFHVLKRFDSFGGFYWGEDVRAIEADGLPLSGGWHYGKRFETGQLESIGVQIDNAVWIFETLEMPPQATIEIGEAGETGLHTNNHGGFRLRIEIPEGVNKCRVRIGFRAAVRVALSEGIEAADVDSTPIFFSS